VVELPLPLREKIERLTYTAIMEVRSDADLDAMMRDVAEHLTPTQRARVETARQALEAAYEGPMRSGLARGELRELDPRLVAHAYAHLLAAFAGRVGVELGIGVALGVLLDTILVRALLVPGATLQLGRAAWWPTRMGASSPRRPSS